MRNEEKKNVKQMHKYCKMYNIEIKQYMIQ